MKRIINALYRMFIELAEGLAPQSHYHVRHQLQPIKIENQKPYHQKYHS